MEFLQHRRDVGVFWYAHDQSNAAKDSNTDSLSRDHKALVTTSRLHQE